MMQAAITICLVPGQYDFGITAPCVRRFAPAAAPYRESGLAHYPIFGIVDALAQISLFVKLKLASCARPGNRAGFSVGHRRSIRIQPAGFAADDCLQPCGRCMAPAPSRSNPLLPDCIFNGPCLEAMHFCLVVAMRSTAFRQALPVFFPVLNRENRVDCTPAVPPVPM
jgi:hypothetical protein